jgi:hypothetical protein
LPPPWVTTAITEDNTTSSSSVVQLLLVRSLDQLVHELRRRSHWQTGRALPGPFWCPDVRSAVLGIVRVVDFFDL